MKIYQVVQKTINTLKKEKSKMKDYQHNKLPKNPKYLAVVRKTINNSSKFT